MFKEEDGGVGRHIGVEATMSMPDETLDLTFIK